MSWTQKLDLDEETSLICRGTLTNSYDLSDGELSLENTLQVSEDKGNPNATNVGDFRMKLLHVLMSVCVSSTLGLTLNTSYLIEPTYTSCPEWGDSVVVISGAVLLLVIGFTGILGGHFLRKLGAGPSLFIGTVSAGFAYGICGLAVLTCRHSPVVTKVVFVAAFGSLGIGNSLNYMVTLMVLLSWFPTNQGRANGYNTIWIGVAYLWLCQLFIFFQHRARDGDLTAATIYFVLGIITVAGSAPFIFIIRFAASRVQPIRKMSFRELFKTRQCQIFLFVSFAGPLPALAVESKLNQILLLAWGKPNAPVEVLSLLVLSGYVIGPIFWMITADSIGAVNVWKIVCLLHFVLLIILPSTVTAQNFASAWSSVVLLALLTVLFAGLKGTSGAVCCDAFTSSNSSTALGVGLFGYGVSGLVGPILCQIMYTHFDSYNPFLYGFSCLPLISFILLFFLKPIKK